MFVYPKFSDNFRSQCFNHAGKSGDELLANGCEQKRWNALELNKNYKLETIRMQRIRITYGT